MCSQSQGYYGHQPKTSRVPAMTTPKENLPVRHALEVPTEKGWYECWAIDDRWGGEMRYRAWGGSLWWVPLQDGWLSAQPGIYRWRGPVADVMGPAPDGTNPQPPAPASASEIAALMRTYSIVEPVMGASRVLCEAAFGTVARAIAARWGRPTVVPVPVTEGRPTATDCDEQGRCWWGENDGYGDATWEFCAYSRDTALWSHWLPAGALPVPPPEDNTTPEP